MDERKLPEKGDASAGAKPRPTEKPGSAAAQQRTEAEEDNEEMLERTEGKEHADALLDEALDMTFPASDPVAFTPPRNRKRRRR